MGDVAGMMEGLLHLCLWENIPCNGNIDGEPELSLWHGVLKCDLTG